MHSYFKLLKIRKLFCLVLGGKNRQKKWTNLCISLRQLRVFFQLIVLMKALSKIYNLYVVRVSGVTTIQSSIVKKVKIENVAKIGKKNFF